MGYLSVIVAAVAVFAFGALWYGVLAEQWKAASQVALDSDGNPINSKSPTPYITSFVATIIVAGFLRLMLEEIGMTSFWNAVQWGTGVGLFFITPWIALNNGFSNRTFRLTAIDGGYATIGCGIMAAVLYWMAPAVA